MKKLHPSIRILIPFVLIIVGFLVLGVSLIPSLTNFLEFGLVCRVVGAFFHALAIAYIIYDWLTTAVECWINEEDY